MERALRTRGIRERLLVNPLGNHQSSQAAPIERSAAAHNRAQSRRSVGDYRGVGPGSSWEAGSPRVFGRAGSKRADEIFGERYFRCVNSNDVIPRLPRLFRRNLGWLPGWFPWLPTTRPMRHCGRLVLLTEDGFALHQPSRARVLLERLVGWRADMARDHFVAAYLGALS